MDFWTGHLFVEMKRTLRSAQNIFHKIETLRIYDIINSYNFKYGQLL